MKKVNFWNYSLICFAILIVLVLCLAIIIPPNNNSSAEPSIAKTVFIKDLTEDPPLKVWRAKIKKVETRERWAKIRVESPKDNRDHIFELDVIRQSYDKAYNDLKGMKLKAGEEIWFLRTEVFAETVLPRSLPARAIEIGVFLVFAREGEKPSPFIQIMNPPKK